MTELTNPDDKIFKAVFSRPEFARELLEKFAPADLLEILDLDTLSLSDGSFVDEELGDILPILSILAKRRIENL